LPVPVDGAAAAIRRPEAGQVARHEKLAEPVLLCPAGRGGEPLPPKLMKFVRTWTMTQGGFSRLVVHQLRAPTPLAFPPRLLLHFLSGLSCAFFPGLWILL